MKKILVTTDFSINSKVGIRFAYQLSLQQNVELTFLHVAHISKPTGWSADKYTNFENKELKRFEMELQAFVSGVYLGMDAKLQNAKHVVLNHPNSSTGIMHYAKQHGMDFICISTRGAGIIKKLLGTHSSEIINKSEVPVIVIPKQYRRAKLNHVVYATDLENIENELNNVMEFSKYFDAKTEILHFNEPADHNKAERVMNDLIEHHQHENIRVIVRPVNYIDTLLTNIKSAVKIIKPSLLVTFTHKNQSLIDKLCDAGISSGYSFDAQVPLLVYRKEKG
jgi:nucleotide-binding universal stress UspA family protein